MGSKTILHKMLLAFFALGVAVWGATACGSSTTLPGPSPPPQTQQTQQETTQQQTQRTQQEITQQQTQRAQQEITQPQATQTNQPTPSSGDLAEPFVGTWQETSFQGQPVPLGTQVIVFFPDGTVQSSSSDGSEDWTGLYSVLDDSQIQFTVPTVDNPTVPSRSYVAIYTLNDDGLTISTPDQTRTWQKTG